MTLSEQEFGRIVSYIKARTGIELGQKRVLIAGRLENYLIKNGYKVNKIQPVDMFPFTSHIESVVLLKKTN